jgi:hypothetical protein
VSRLSESSLVAAFLLPGSGGIHRHRAKAPKGVHFK